MTTDPDHPAAVAARARRERRAAERRTASTPAATERPWTASTITDDALDALYAALEELSADRARLRAERDALDAVRRVHQRDDAWCAADDEVWPCPTIRAITGTDRRMAAR